MAKDYGNWKIKKSLSEGGQGQVFLVTTKDGQDTREYVLKRLKNIERLDRFQAEIDAIKKLNHPNVVTYIDSDLTSDNPYLVTEYYPKGSLEDLDTSQWDTIRKLWFFRDVLLGVEIAHVHQPPIIHRDLKPANIFLREDLTPVVGDFGICYADGAGKRLTRAGEAVGPKDYIAPELEDGKADVNPTADVYSLGKVLYWLFAGRIFSREKHREASWLLTGERIDKPTHILAGLEFVNELLDRSIQERPSDRYQDARHFRANLEHVIWRLVMGRQPIDCAPLKENTILICGFCGKGTYRKKIDAVDNKSLETWMLANWGLPDQASSSGWLVLWCDYCGHVQYFLRAGLQHDPWVNKRSPY